MEIRIFPGAATVLLAIFAVVLIAEIFVTRVRARLI